MNRRMLIAGLAALAMAAPLSRARAQSGPAPEVQPLLPAWQAWKSVCLAQDGRVVDGFQNAASHSEGQGYGLALAAIMDDRPAFDAMLDWTTRNLAVRGDALLAWRWQPEADPPVQDRNNAADGDLFQAWALSMAASRQQRPELAERAAAIVQDLLRLCVVPHPDGSGALLFLPGAEGFRSADQVVINPSYYMPLAMRDLAQATDQPRLRQLADDGVRLIDALALAGPVPDWVCLTATGPVPPPARFSQQSGYEAIRVPLFALWSGHATSAAVTAFARTAAAAPAGADFPVVFDPATGAVVERSAHAGYGAVEALAECAGASGLGSAMQPFVAAQPYYPATLHLMALVGAGVPFSEMCADMMKSVVLATLFLALPTVPALAQSAPPADELLALRMYVQQGEDTAARAELRRLQLKYPQWAAPADPAGLVATSRDPQAEIDRFYSQLAAGQTDQARETLAQTRRDFPGWVPPADMAAQLETAEGQRTLDDALSGGDVATARGVAARTPGLLRCDRINNAWRIAEGQRDAGARADALATYRAVLGTCTDPGDLASTLEKADGVASEAELRGMAAGLASRFPAQAARFDAILQRLLAGRGVVTAAPTPASKAEKPASPNEGSKAAKKAAPQSGAQSSPRRSARAEPAAPPARRGETPAQCAARTAGARATGSVLERAWCVYNLDRSMDAMADFKTVLAGRPNAQQRRDAQYGLALVYLKLGMSEPAAQLAATADFDHRQRLDIERQILDQRGVAAYKQRRFRDAIRYFDAIEQVTGSIRRDLAILRAYAYLNAGNQPRALAEFRRLNAELSTTETRRGLQAASGG